MSSTRASSAGRLAHYRWRLISYLRRLPGNRTMEPDRTVNSYRDFCSTDMSSGFHRQICVQTQGCARSTRKRSSGRCSVGGCNGISRRSAARAARAARVARAARAAAAWAAVVRGGMWVAVAALLGSAQESAEAALAAGAWAVMAAAATAVVAAAARGWAAWAARAAMG